MLQYSDRHTDIRVYRDGTDEMEGEWRRKIKRELASMHPTQKAKTLSCYL
jgi:hypothetical protein